MANSLPTKLARTHANPHRTAALDGIRAGASTVRMAAKDLENAPVFRSMVREAMRRVGLSGKAFALTCGQPESVISDALAGRRAFDGQWVTAQSAAFRRELRRIEDEVDGQDPVYARQDSFNDFVEVARRFWFRHQRREERSA